ncbi:hypothetical protein [Dongia sp.]|uniref:hypothetical protein n=1 Tax=Dongia sp. TaxID=1977262 RepID=UPI0035AF1A19
MNPIRLCALALLASASILLVLDGLENFTNSSWNGMATGYLWSIIWPASIKAVKTFIENNISLMMWQRVLLPLLMLPLWVHMLILGIILFFTTKKDDAQP